MQRRGGTVRDKPAPDPQREYLDAESSDESEGKGEQVEKEELRGISKLNDRIAEKLVNFVKNCTHLSRMSEDDWTDQCCNTIKEFFSDSRHTVLTIFYEKGRLTVKLGFPTEPVHELMYFVKQFGESLTLENVYDSVTFGKVHGCVEQILLDSLQNVIDPTMQALYNNMNADFNASMQDFLCKLTDVRYKMLGLTVLYQPLGVSRLTVEEACDDKELVKLLEKIVAHWSQQIRIALEDREQMTSHGLRCLMDEYYFWIYRHENLCGLKYQLENPLVKHIINIITTTQSPKVRQFLSLCKEIEHSVIESESNIDYLEILKKPCENLDACVTPSEVKCKLQSVIHHIRVIWLNSPYLNSPEKMTRLFSLLSNQVIIICRYLCNMKDIFAGHTRMGIHFFQECIALCEYYKKLYKQNANAHNPTSRGWDLNAEQIFHFIEIFIVRCYDMIEICYAMISFARMDETKEIPMPTFSGAKGPSFESVCREVENQFLQHLRSLESVSHKILDVQQHTWYDNMYQFCKQMKELDRRIENLVNNVFKYSTNPVRDLAGIYNYKNRDNLRILFENTVTTVWKMLREDIQTVKQRCLDESNEHPSAAPSFSGRALNLQLKVLKLARTKQILEDASWMPYCNASEEVNYQHTVLMKSAQEAIRDLYREWVANVGNYPQNRLDRYLMRRSTVDKQSPLECNMDLGIPNLCREATHWINDLHFDIPTHIRVIYDKWSSLVFVYESVLSVALAYNKILEALLIEERNLFEELIKQLDKKIEPGLNKLTWNSDRLDVYIQDCNIHIKKLQEFIDTYKLSNMKIIRMCKQIYDTPMIKIRLNYVYTLPELVGELTDVRDKVARVIAEKYKSIIQYLKIVYNGFLPVIEKSLAEWTWYLKKFDVLLEETFKLCLINSMTVMYEALRGDETAVPTHLLVVYTNLVDKKISYSPSLLQIQQFIGNILNDLLSVFKSFPRIVEWFEILYTNIEPFSEKFLRDEDLQRLQNDLNKEMVYCYQQVKKYEESWEEFAEVWTVDEEFFIRRFELSTPSIAVFESNMQRYSELVAMVKVQEPLDTIHFLDVISEGLKAAIINLCLVGQQRLTDLLQRMTQTMIDHVYQYITENTKIITKEPTDLITMQTTMQLFESLAAEIPKEQKEFPKIKEQYETLEKYEVPMTLEFKRKIRNLDVCWAAYLDLFASSENILHDKKSEFRTKLLQEAATLKDITLNTFYRFYDSGPFTSDWISKDALTWLANFRVEMDALKGKEKKLKEDLSILEISQLDSPEFAKLDEDLTAIEITWQLIGEWEAAWERFKTCNFWTLELNDIEAIGALLFRKLSRLCRELSEKNWEVLETTKLQVDKFRRTLPLIVDLKNTAMRDRHWQRVKDVIGQQFDQTATSFTLSVIMNLEMQDFVEQISEISHAATMELAIETNLKNIESSWNTIKLDIIPCKGKGIWKIKSVDEINQLLEEHQVQLATMKTTRFVEPFINTVDYWERTLSTISEVLEMFLLVQRGYLYLDNIFTAEDIKKQIPKETECFNKLTVSWKEVTSRMAEAALVLPATHEPPGLLSTLNKMNIELESIQRALELFLETKRHIFPRFYFISNDDLLEILGNSKNPDLIQPHVKKLFENIKYLTTSKSLSGKTLAEGMSSSEGEYVEFLKPVILEGPAEMWLREVETAMRECLRVVLRQCRAALREMLGKQDKWVKEWQSQPGITSTQIQWTADCTRALIHCKRSESKKPLKKLKKRQNQALATYSEAIRGNLNRLQRLKFKAIVVIEIHARDVVEKMYKSNCRDVSTFEWLSQLRFYWDKKVDDCIVCQTNTSFPYGYEYLGNSERLVITPLTDRCYITLTTALHLHRGGNPKGPAGTGKTETVKDLGKALGMNVIVTNCSEGLDYKSMGRQFSGLSQTGAWGCFDEFNRINIEVLSVVAQQIYSILNALSQKLTRFVFEASEISLVHTCGIFITMNPGYAGRTELPDNLKSMFRPISMMVPDSSMIAEINLFSEGFQNNRALAVKIFTLYTLAKQQLSKQYHYDFGLRGIVTLTRYAGRKRRAFPNLTDEEVIILAMNDMNVAKLTSDDLPLFTGITSDLFPGIEVPVVDYEQLIDFITKEAKALQLQPIPSLVKKVTELYETKNSRHSTMIVGCSNTGKSATWRTLKRTMTSLNKNGKSGFNIVHVYPINPKALNLGELYGECNLSTGEWHDGVISSIMRKTCSDNSSNEKWIIFDGPVDAVWIENMNSVMDDNKILTLINNDRITMPEQVSLLFEVENLAEASPATVSRAGMVYMDYKDLGWRPHVNSWLQKYHHTEFVEEMDQLFERYVNKTLDFKRLNCEEPIPIPELNAVQSLCKLLEVLVTPQNGMELGEDRETFATICKMWFLFCMIWSLCASVNEEGRQKMDNFIREIEGSFPLRDTVYEYYVDARQQSFLSWEEKLSQSWKFPAGIPFHDILVPTVDTIRYEYLLRVLLEHEFPVLLVGPVGTGKTSTARLVVDSFDHKRYTLLVLNMSAQTTSDNIQEIIESRIQKRTKEVYVPADGKTMITFIDDFNMPMKDTYGSQPPLELIRQWITYKFWYDRTNQSRRYVEKMQLMAAMGPPGGGRNTIPQRLLTRFNIVNMTFPAEKQIVRIYGTILDQQLFDFHPEVKGISNDVTLATIDVYNQVVANMLPTPAKMHYLFNLRDISRIFQGLLRSNKDYQYSKQTFLRLWIHETFRVFSDRLIDEKDNEWFTSQINNTLVQYFELTFNTLCPEKKCPTFGSFMNVWNIYDDLRDVAAIRRYVEAQMDEYNASPGVVRLDLILFRDAVEHICRIVRVISEPRGNMLLVGIGGSGRQSLSRVAGYMCELTTFQIEVTKHYLVPEFREDLKVLYNMAGVENKPSSFLFNDTQIVEEQFLEIVNNMLNTGEVANLYKSDEMEDIRNRLAAEATKEGVSLTSEAIYHFLIQRVRQNLRVILCMNPVGNAFKNRLRQYPSLISCTTIDWFHDWPHEALLEVGNKFLVHLNLTLTITGKNKEEPMSSTNLQPSSLQDHMRDSTASTFAFIHNSVLQFSRKMAIEMKRYNYVTPTNFLELVSGYEQMLVSKRREIAEQANKLRSGLFKLEDTRKKVNEMAEELEATQQQVLRSTRECEEYLVTIADQRRDADETQTIVTAKSERIAEESKECKKLEELARADLASVEPALEEAMKALDALNKKDLSEIKSFTRPPPRVEMVMEAVMILKNSEPTWTESKRQLGDVNFLNTLRDFDKDHISDKVLKTIGRYTSNREFDPDKVGLQSIAAKSLCMWVIAMEKYGKLYRIVAPKREKLAAALKSLQQKEAALAETTAQLQKLREELKRLQQIYDSKMKEKEDLIRQADLLKIKLERAALLVDGLSSEWVRWQNIVESLDQFFDLLPGNCLIATAFISYLGPFISHYREELVKVWKQEILENEIPLSENFDVKEFLCDMTTIREWNIEGLPSDDFSTENGVIVTWSTRWPLIIDPQYQAVKWIKNMEAKNALKVIDLGQVDFTKVLEHAMQFGKPVLLQNIGESLDPILNPILERAFVKSGDQILIKFNDKMVTFDKRFRLFITTKLPNPHYPPEICTKCTLCNFAIKEQGLVAQLLGIVVRKEKPQLEEQKDNLVMTIASGKRILQEIEDKILHLLSVTTGSLLDDVDLLNTLQTSKSTSITVEESLRVSEETEKEIDQAREEYKFCANRAAILFFIINDMSLVDPMYQFSLNAYITLFLLSIEKSPKYTNLNERIKALNDYHTYAVYKNTCRGLFERHKLLFSFHMCMKILEAQETIVQDEYTFFLKGGIVLDRKRQPIKPVPWLPDESWDNISELDKLTSFQGVVDSIIKYPKDWYNWYVNPEPEVIPLVGEFEKRCNDFQKMLFIRSCRPDRISFSLTTFIINNLGLRFVESCILDFEEVLKDSTPQTPLIFVLSPGVDPTVALVQLAADHNMTHKFFTLSLGQGQASIATEKIRMGAKDGYWVFLANCHLSLSWMSQLSKIIETLGTSKSVHPEFRLWLSSSPTPEFPISILQASIKMTTEPPKGLKANMKRLYGLITDTQFQICQAESKYKKLLFVLVFFHAVLLERRKFQQLGWNVIYSFNDSDFEVSENLLQVYLDFYSETPWESLRYLIAEICYGGHVTDNWDRRLLMVYAQQYFTKDVLDVPYHRLSSLPTYYVPRDGSLESYRDFISTLPSTDRPEIFGQHPNADITSLIIDTRNTLKTLMILQMQAPSAEDETDKEDKVLQLSADILLKLPQEINYETTSKHLDPANNPLDVVLLQEIARYNYLLTKTRASLEDLQRGIKGLVLMSTELEEIFACIYEGRVPPSWLTTYPSLKLLGSWTRDLLGRVEHFAIWAETTHPPLLFWLAAFIFPTGFLTAVLQTSARLSNISIDSLSWEFTVFNTDESNIVELPADGVYVRSMFLEGAGWDMKNGTLVEPAPMQLVYNMPVIYFKPTKHIKKKTKGIYNCPCYYYPQRSGDQTRSAFIVVVELKSGPEGPNFWIKRGTALLLSLAN